MAYNLPWRQSSWGRFVASLDLKRSFNHAWKLEAEFQSRMETWSRLPIAQGNLKQSFRLPITHGNFKQSSNHAWKLQAEFQSRMETFEQSFNHAWKLWADFQSRIDTKVNIVSIATRNFGKWSIYTKHGSSVLGELVQMTVVHQKICLCAIRANRRFIRPDEVRLWQSSSQKNFPSLI